MGNLFASFSTGVSGLHSAQTSLNTAAHNLANATTPGHTRQQAVVTDSFYSTRFGAYGNRMQIGYGTDVVQIRQIRNTFLDDQYRLQTGRQSFYEAQYDAVSEMETLFGELEAEEFIDSMTSLWEKLQELAKSPDDIVRRTELVSVSTQFIERAQVLQDQLKAYQTNMNDEIRSQVERVNEIVSEVSDCNMLIRRYEATGERANDYRDQRNLLLDELSSIIKFETSEERDGTVSIFAEGAFLLTGDSQVRLDVAYESEDSKLLKPVWAYGVDFFRRGELFYSSETETDVGSLKGLLVARGPKAADYTDMPVKPVEEDFIDKFGTLDERAYTNAMEAYDEQVEYYNQNVDPSVIMRVQAEFDQLIRGIAMMINDTICPDKELTLSDGTKLRILDTDIAPIGDDADKTMGTELFVRRNTPRYTETELVDEFGNALLDADGNPLVDAKGKPLKVYVYNEEDPSDRYTQYTIDQLEVNTELLRDPSKLPLNENPNTGHVGGFSQKMCDKILEKWGQEFSTLDPNAMTRYNFTDYYKNLVDQFSTEGYIWRGIIENQIITVNSIEGERQNVMGVSTEEELADLIKFQKCFDASSRYITVVDEMIEHLITSL
ncbi:MAG: flagellar hook-associated protein FlgK [Roseburia sp.]|nr:flagellar hook-associated protein FlgK [Roseburia sp.]